MIKKMPVLIITIIFLLSINLLSTQYSYAESENSEEISGTYRISMFESKNCHMAMEVENGSKELGANVQIGEWVNKNNEKNKFIIEYDKTDESYIIKSANSGKVLDSQNGGTTEGTNVWQYKYNGTDAQKWKLQKNEDGSYSISSKKSGLYISVENGNIQLNKDENKNEQKFKLICLDNKEERTIEDGVYKISTKENNNIVLQTRETTKENGIMIETGKWTEEISNTQRKFKITYNEDDGYYTIKSVSTEKVLDAQNGGMTNGTKIWQYTGNYTDAQRWKIEKNSDGSYSFMNKKSELYLDLGEKTSEGETVQIYEKTGKNRQKFELEKVKEKPEQYIENGIYRISMFDNSKIHMAIEIENGSNELGANVRLGEWVNRNNEKNKFRLTYDKTSGFYTIESTNSGKALDAQNGGTKDSTNIWQYNQNGTDAQKWEIQKNKDGSYSFINKKSGLYLSDENSNIQINTGKNIPEQKFKIISLENIAPKTIEDGIYKIETVENTNNVIAVNGASRENEANIKTENWTEVDNFHKKFKLKYNKDDGYYTIGGMDSEKVLDAQSGGITEGTNVWQYTGNYTDAQRWKIEKNSDGSYSFINKKSNLYLTENNGNIEIRSKTETAKQKFNIVGVSITNAEEYVEEGTYKIVVSSNKNVSFDVKDESREMGANIQLGNTSDTIRNEFNIIPDGKGYYIIRSINSGNVLDVQNGGTEIGTNVWQYKYNGTDAQKWIIRHNIENDTYSIISKKSGLSLDIQNGNTNVGGNVQIYTKNGTPAQTFSFIKQEKKSERWIEDNEYKFLTNLNEKIGFDIEAGSKENGGIVQIWKYVRGPQQQFSLAYKDGYYFIINKNSGKALQVVSNEIRQYDIDYSNDNQKWKLEYINGDYFSIIAKSSNQCICIPNNDSSNGVDLRMSEYTKNNNQIFKIQEIERVKLETGYYGESGLKVIGDSRGSLLRFYKIGDGPNVLFTTFAVHGFEDLWDFDGQELTRIAEKFKEKLIEIQDISLAEKWTIYIFPSVNPDGEYHGYTNNGPGRTGLYSDAPKNKGIDVNRCWSTGYVPTTRTRNYNGTAPFQSYESTALRDFLLNKKATNGQTILIDLHGWLNEAIGDSEIGEYYRNEFGMSKQIYTYGSGYLVNWARANLGCKGRTARSALIEMPGVSNSAQVERDGFAEKYINATLKMLRNM